MAAIRTIPWLAPMGAYETRQQMKRQQISCYSDLAIALYDDAVPSYRVLLQHLHHWRVCDAAAKYYHVVFARMNVCPAEYGRGLPIVFRAMRKHLLRLTDFRRDLVVCPSSDPRFAGLLPEGDSLAAFVPHFERKGHVEVAESDVDQEKQPCAV